MENFLFYFFFYLKSLLKKKKEIPLISSFTILLVTNKLNYHKSCHKDVVNKYKQKVIAEFNRDASLQNEVNEFWKAVCFNKKINKRNLCKRYRFWDQYITKALWKTFRRKQCNIFSSSYLLHGGNHQYCTKTRERSGKAKVKAIFEKTLLII